MQGYERGKGRSFTPSMYCKWIEVFNDLLNDMDRRGIRVSRNSLTEELIEDGLRYRNIIKDNNLSVQIPSDGLTPEEIQVIQSEQGQLILKNLIRSMLGKGGTAFSIPFPSADVVVTDNPREISDGELKAEAKTTDYRIEQEEKQLNENVESEKVKIPAQGAKISARQKAMERLNKINI